MLRLKYDLYSRLVHQRKWSKPNRVKIWSRVNQCHQLMMHTANRILTRRQWARIRTCFNVNHWMCHNRRSTCAKKSWEGEWQPWHLPTIIPKSTETQLISKKKNLIIRRYYGSMYPDQRRPGAPPGNLLQNIKEEPQSLHDSMGDKEMYPGKWCPFSSHLFLYSLTVHFSHGCISFIWTDLNGQVHPMHQGHNQMPSHSASQSQHRDKDRGEPSQQPKNLKSSTQVRIHSQIIIWSHWK